MKWCNKCEKYLPESQFYTLKNGYVDWWCKQCRCEGCSDNKPWTYFCIMSLYDIPYIEMEWLNLMKHQIRKTINDNGPYISIFGKYFSKMKLCGFKNYGFKDSAKLNSDFQKNKYDRELFLDKDIVSYLEVLIKER